MHCKMQRQFHGPKVSIIEGKIFTGKRQKKTSPAVAGEVTIIKQQKLFLPSGRLCKCISFFRVLTNLIAAYRRQVDPIRERIPV